MKQSIKYLLYLIDEILIGGFLIALLYYFCITLWISLSILVIYLAIVLVITYFHLPQFKQPATGNEGIIGKKGVVVDTLDPEGTVQIRGELWHAESLNGAIQKQENVIVQHVDGLQLFVTKMN